MTSVEFPNILQVAGLEAGYGDYSVLKDLVISVPRGAMVTVIGPNGSGKSTLLKAIYGLAKVRSGHISLNLNGTEIDLRRLQPCQISAMGINYLPQLDNIFVDLSVRENLEIGAVLVRTRFETNLERTLAWFPILKPLLKRRAGILSGGQQKMLGFARALMTDPKLLLLDEPSAGLAPALAGEVFQKVSEMHKAGISILIVEQNARRSLSLSDYGYVLDQGRNRIEGAAQDLLHDPKIIGLYLGDIGRYGRLRREKLNGG